MTDLWMILVLLGVSIVLAVVMFNWWQEKKYRREVEYRFNHSRTDILDNHLSSTTTKGENDSSGTLGVKGGFSDDIEGWMSEPRVRQTTKKVEPAFKETVHQESDHKPDSLNVKTEVNPVAPLENTYEANQSVVHDHAISTEQTALLFSHALPESTQPLKQSKEDVVLSSLHSVTDALPQSLNLEMDLVGLIDAPLGILPAQLADLVAEIKTFANHTNLWVRTDDNPLWINMLSTELETLKESIPLNTLACSLQLADRSGAVDESTLKRFQKSIETIGRNLGLQVQWQGSYVPAEQAHAIDAFCIEVDKAVEFHVLALNGMFHATKLRGLAEANGLHLSEDGRYELLSADGQLEFSIRNYEGKPFSVEMLKSAVMTGVTFQLDIPTTTNNLQVFDRMIEIARTMTVSLNANMIDVNKKPIGDSQLDKIRQQLKNISLAMEAKGILPGSTQAQRLFS